MNRFVTFALLVIFMLSACGSAPQIDASEYLMTEYSNQVVMITPPSTNRMGGTGFEVRAPSGKVYTLTNAHICRIAEDGKLALHMQGTDRVYIAKVIEVSEDTDVCLAEGLPAASGLQLADKVNERAPIYAIGHPFLKPLTSSRGYIISRQTHDIMEEAEPENCKGKHRKVVTEMTLFGPMQFCVSEVEAYETTMPIFPGNSGSPALNSMGYVVGIVFAGDRRDNHGLVVPLDHVRNFLKIY